VALIVNSWPDGEVTRRKKAAQDRLAPKQGTLSFEDDLQEMKPKFPTGEELADTVAVKRVLEGVAEPVSIEEIARHFAQGKQIEKRVGLAVVALARLGHLSAAARRSRCAAGRRLSGFCAPTVY
jgi:hypothetical protein